MQDASVWPMVIVSLPERPTETIEILAILDPESVSLFVKLGFKVNAHKAGGDGSAEGGFVFEEDIDDADFQRTIDEI